MPLRCLLIAFLLSADYFFHFSPQKIPFGILLVSSSLDPVPIRPEVLLGLIWVQIVCIGYQQKILVDKELIYISRINTTSECLV